MAFLHDTGSLRGGPRQVLRERVRVGPHISLRQGASCIPEFLACRVIYIVYIFSHESPDFSGPIVTRARRRVSLLQYRRCTAYASATLRGY